MVQPDLQSHEGNRPCRSKSFQIRGEFAGVECHPQRRDLAVLEVQPVGDGHGEATVVCRSNHVSTSGPSTKTF